MALNVPKTTHISKLFLAWQNALKLTCSNLKLKISGEDPRPLISRKGKELE